MKNLFLSLFALLFLMNVNVFAENVELDVNASLVNKSVFRGKETSDVVSVVPSVTTTLFKFVEVGVESTFPLTATNFALAEEHVFSTSLLFRGNVQVGLNNYYYPDDTPKFLSKKAHSLEPFVEVLYGGTSLYGAVGLNNGLKESVYLQLSQVLSAQYNQGVVVWVGVGNRVYTNNPVSDEFDLVNLGAKVYKNRFEVSYILNPNTEISHLVFGVNF